MKFTQSPIILFCSLALLFCGCSKRNDVPRFTNGMEITATLDSLFGKLETIRTQTNPNPEGLVEINERIRRTIEHIGSQRLLHEMQNGYENHNHLFSYILSPDQKVAIFSWYTHLENSGNRIKNIALYDSDTKMVPTSLYGTPVIYNGIHQIKTYGDETIYLLQGQDSIQQRVFYRLNAYLLKNGYLEETPAFPNNESSFALTSLSNSSKRGRSPNFKIEMNGLRILFQDNLDTSNVENAMAFDGKKYILEKEYH